MFTMPLRGCYYLPPSVGRFCDIVHFNGLRDVHYSNLNVGDRPTLSSILLSTGPDYVQAQIEEDPSALRAKRFGPREAETTLDTSPAVSALYYIEDRALGTRMCAIQMLN